MRSDIEKLSANHLVAILHESVRRRIRRPTQPHTATSRSSSAALVCCLVLLAAFAAPAAEAMDAKIYRITNNTGAPASDLHVTFTGTGGDLTTTVLVNPPGCPAPAIPSNGTRTNTMVLDWGANCVAPGAAVTVRVVTINGPLHPNSGFWTSPTHPKKPGSGPVRPERDIEELDEEPGGQDARPFCCQYLCFDAPEKPYLIVARSDDECLTKIGTDPQCSLVASFRFTSSEECPIGVHPGGVRSGGR